MTRNLAITGLLCLGSAAALCSAPVQARTFVDIGINVAPPAPRYERVVVRPGYAWHPGYYQWEGPRRRYVWVGGYYMRARAGHAWVPAHWRQGPHGGWHFVRGHWS